MARPVIVARREFAERRIVDVNLGWRLGKDVEIVDPMAGGPLLDGLIEPYRKLTTRRGVSVAEAALRIQRKPAVTAAMLLRTGHVDAALVGGNSEWWSQVQLILPLAERTAGVSRAYALTALIRDNGAPFILDTHMVPDPTAEQIAEMTQLAARQLRIFGVEPKAALLSHSNFGASDSVSARKMRDALHILRSANVDFEVDGEMHADAALSDELLSRLVHDAALKGSANLLVMPNLDSANISATLLCAASNGLTIGPMILGLDRPLHVLVPTTTARGIVNLTAIASAAVARRS